MSVKVFIYVIVSVLVIFSLDSLNINKFFKKNKIFQATLFYFFIGLSLIYLVSNFIYDFFTSLN